MATLKRLETNEMLLNNLIEGSLLGDAAISASYDKRQNTTNWYYDESHGRKQEEYARWKAGVFEENGFVATVSKRQREAQIRGRKIMSDEHRFHVYGNQFFGPIRTRWYHTGAKQVPGDFKMNPEKLAIWYMDDAAFHFFRGTVELYSNGFNKQSHHILQRELAHFRISASIVPRRKDGKKFYITYLPKKEGWKLVSLIEPFILPCLRYKAPEGYMLFAEDMPAKTRARSISTRLPVEEARRRIVNNLRDFHARCGTVGGFPVVRYLYDSTSYSFRPIQRLFGSFAAALVQAGLPETLV